LNFALLLEEVGSQTFSLPYRYQYQQLPPQHGLKMDENSLHSTFQESLVVGLNISMITQDPEDPEDPDIT
jgi:hypothetical protein